MKHSTSTIDTLMHQRAVVGCYDLFGSTQNNYLMKNLDKCHIHIDQDLMNPMWKSPFGTQSVEPGNTLRIFMYE